MVLLLVIGFLAGVVTAISPCVLPVLPILLAGGASGGRRRPYAIIAGLVLSFTVFTLTAAWILGKLGLVDFWTYSCINCLRTLPHLEAWDRAYRKDGLVIVGVHTPEFAFEHSLSNVRKATRRLGVRYPVALDNDYATWNAYSNQYWPAEYLLDRRGHVRHYHFGEGEYDRTEQLIRQLVAPARSPLPTATAIADRTPMALTTPESYLGYERLDRYAGSRITRDRFATYRFPKSLSIDELAY